MPTYDFRCADGHVHEERTAFSVEVLPCPSCGAPAKRLAVPSRPARFGGFAIQPMAERGFPLDRMVNAQHEMIDQARRAGVEAPDVLGIAKRRAAAIQKHSPELVTGT